MNKGIEQEQDKKNPVVERKYAKSTADVEIARPVGVVACVEQDAGDQEAGENKKDIYTGPAPGDRSIVLKKYEQKGNRAQAIQRRIEYSIFRLRLGGIPGDGV